jgi:hypothetical protein
MFIPLKKDGFHKYKGTKPHFVKIQMKNNNQTKESMKNVLVEETEIRKVKIDVAKFQSKVKKLV